MTFSGFDRAFALLDELPSWSSEEFEAHKRQLHDGLSEPGRALITDLAARLDAKHTVDSRSSVSPLHRDLRFAPAGSARYKDHLLLTTWEGADKKTSPTLWIRIDARRVGFASGLGFTPTSLCHLAPTTHAPHSRVSPVSKFDSPTDWPTRSQLQTWPTGAPNGSRNSSPCTAGCLLTSRNHDRQKVDPRQPPAEVARSAMMSSGL